MDFTLPQFSEDRSGKVVDKSWGKRKYENKSESALRGCCYSQSERHSVSASHPYSCNGGAAMSIWAQLSLLT